jgi:hypothetical protein
VIESVTCPGVTVTLKKLSKGRKDKLEMRMADANSKRFELARRFASIVPAADSDDSLEETGAVEKLIAKLDQEQALEFAELNRETAVMEDTVIIPAYLRTFINKIEGLEIDGQAATVDLLLEDGPEELVDELYGGIVKLLTVSKDEAKNSESPSTSVAVEGGSPTPTSATSADSKDST